MAALLKKKAAKKEVDLDSMVKSGAQGAYEALQLYRSRAIRFKTKNDFPSAIKLVASGAICLFENSYENAGAELAEVFVELLVEENKEVTEENRKTAFDIDENFTPTNTRRVEYLKSCIKWTAACGSRELGDPLFHARLAECLWDKNDKESKNAPYHFAIGESPILYCRKIFATYPNQDQGLLRDRALTVAIVNFLSLENLRDANEMYSFYIAELKSKSFSTHGELLTFCDYLLQTCRRDAQKLFKQIVNAYAAKLDFDPTVPDMLMGPIAQRFFGIQPKISPMMSILKTMLA